MNRFGASNWSSMRTNSFVRSLMLYVFSFCLGVCFQSLMLAVHVQDEAPPLHNEPASSSGVAGAASDRTESDVSSASVFQQILTSCPLLSVQKYEVNRKVINILADMWVQGKAHWICLRREAKSFRRTSACQIVLCSGPTLPRQRGGASTSAHY